MEVPSTCQMMVHCTKCLAVEMLVVEVVVVVAAFQLLEYQM